MTLKTALEFYSINELVSFRTRKEAKNYISSLDGENYHLSHNESSRPDYSIVKMPYEDIYFISRTRYFYGPSKSRDFLTRW